MPNFSGLHQIRMSRIGLFDQISEITDNLYLSGASVLKTERLRQKRITSIVNATTEEPNAYLSGIDYIKIAIEDNPFAKIDQYFDLVADRIKSVKDKGGRILVHCVAGVSRSATLCIIYLVKYERMTLRQAYTFVKSARPIIRPNIGFWKQMIDYEKRHRGVASVTMVLTNQCDQAIPDVYCSELRLRLLQHSSPPKPIPSGAISIPNIFGNRGILPSSSASRSAVAYRRSASPAVGSSFIPISSRFPSRSLLSPAPTRRRDMGTLFGNLYHSAFSAF